MEIFVSRTVTQKGRVSVDEDTLKNMVTYMQPDVSENGSTITLSFEFDVDEIVADNQQDIEWDEGDGECDIEVQSIETY